MLMTNCNLYLLQEEISHNISHYKIALRYKIEVSRCFLFMPFINYLVPKFHAFGNKQINIFGHHSDKKHFFNRRYSSLRLVNTIYFDFTLVLTQSLEPSKTCFLEF